MDNMLINATEVEINQYKFHKNMPHNKVFNIPFWHKDVTLVGFDQNGEVESNGLVPSLSQKKLIRPKQRGFNFKLTNLYRLRTHRKRNVGVDPSNNIKLKKEMKRQKSIPCIFKTPEIMPSNKIKHDTKYINLGGLSRARQAMEAIRKFCKLKKDDVVELLWEKFKQDVKNCKDKPSHQTQFCTVPGFEDKIKYDEVNNTIQIKINPRSG